jgi:hypothetical protein
MSHTQQLAALRIVLIVVGLFAVFAVWPLMILWPSGWAWHSGHSDYPLMIVGIYATLGAFLFEHQQAAGRTGQRRTMENGRRNSRSVKTYSDRLR